MLDSFRGKFGHAHIAAAVRVRDYSVLEIDRAVAAHEFAHGKPSESLGSYIEPATITFGGDEDEIRTITRD